MSNFYLTLLGKIIWEDRYALKDESGNLIEKDILETFRRVAKAIASKEKDPVYWEEKFYNLMANRYFCPAGRVLAHAGTPHSQLLNCFVLPFENDSLEAIMETAKNMAITQKYSGGTGFNYSILRPAGSYIKGVNGHSCGVMGFMHMMSTTSEVIEQGGSRRGASLGLLEVWHPDIWEFISYKAEHHWDRLTEFMQVQDEKKWSEFKFENLHKLQMYNISVGITDEFLQAVNDGKYWHLTWDGVEWELYTVTFKKYQADGTYKVDDFDVVADCDKTALWKIKKKIPFPTSKDIFEIKSRRKILATELWDRLCHNAWADGCPGLINLSTARKMHNLEYANPMLSTNPCGEQILPANGSCNLSSLVASSFLMPNNEFDWERFREAIHTAIRFSDNVIDNCVFPLKAIETVALQERRVGLGLMGVHDLLLKMGLCYDSPEGRKFIEGVLRFLRDVSYEASACLSEEKGCFPAFVRDDFMLSGFVKTLPRDIQDFIYLKGMRTASVNSIAPNGTIGAMLNCSTGCEPWFSLSFQRSTRLGSYEDGCPVYIQWKNENPNKEVPAYFKTAQEISPEDHIKMLILFSKYIDSSVSKTVNLPNTATVDDVKKAFMLAMTNGVKGITVFRDGSKEGVLKDKKAVIKEAKKIVSDLQHIEDGDSRINPKSRGNRVCGATTRVHMQSHNLYVTVNKNSTGDMVEVFATVGTNKKHGAHHTSGVENSWAQGLAKTISLALRAGVKVSSIIRNLKNIPSDKPVFSTIGDCESSELIPSPPHAIARILEEEDGHSYQKTSKVASENLPDGRICDECGSSKTHKKSATCYTCLSCGHEQCG